MLDDSNSAIIGVINPEIDSINKDLLNNIDNGKDNAKNLQNEIDNDNENQVLEPESVNNNNQPEESKKIFTGSIIKPCSACCTKVMFF